jgi:hypothetical protein
VCKFPGQEESVQEIVKKQLEMEKYKGYFKREDQLEFFLQLPLSEEHRLALIESLKKPSE